MRTTLASLVLGSALLSACAPGDEPAEPAEAVGRAEQALSGAATDTTDSAVVFLYIRYPSTYETGCTGTVIAPRVVLTAAHCLLATKGNPNPTETPDTISVGFGSNFQNIDVVGGVENGGKHFVANPLFDATQPAHGHDTGIVFLSSDAPVAGLGYNAGAPPASWIGQPARLIGYGETSSGAGDSKIRREVDLPIGSVGGASFFFAGPNGACHGDSGGPALLNGTNTIIGVASTAVGGTCTGGSDYSRTDVDADFINAQVASVAGSGSGGSGGTTPPKTNGCDMGENGRVPNLSIACLLAIGALLLRRRVGQL